MRRAQQWLILVTIAVMGIACSMLWPRHAPGAPPLRRFTSCVVDFPVGPPDAIGYYDAQPFGEHDHLGSDWNGNGGADSDLGDPVHAMADGRVAVAEDLGGGWGNVVRIEHVCGLARFESVSAHLDEVHVGVGVRVLRGESIGTIGTAHGQYLAHLHLELRKRIGAPIGAGYGDAAAGQVDPTAFIRDHRPD